jgi:hypothetical protein
MKKVLLMAMLLGSMTAQSQTILSGSEVFGKDRKEGFYMNINVEEKFIKKDWEEFISKYGGINSSKGVFTIAKSKMNDIAADPVDFTSKVSGEKGKSTVFVAFDTGGGNMVASSSSGYSGVEKLMQSFYSYAMHNEDVRLAEKDAEESQKSLDKVSRTGEKIAREIEKNKKEKENLLKKIEENKTDLEKLLKDQTANVQDVENAKMALEEKKKSVQVVKEKKF